MTHKRLTNGLKEYLECEVLLTSFFREVNFCFPECLSKPIGKYRAKMEMPGDPTTFSGNIGCCPYDGWDICNNEWLANRSLLNSERLNIYGAPDEKPGRCGYHAEKGCTLDTHRAPTCLAYACSDFRIFVSQNYGIRYNWEDIEETLENILAGNISDWKSIWFKKRLKAFSSRVKSRKA